MRQEDQILEEKSFSLKKKEQKKILKLNFNKENLLRVKMTKKRCFSVTEISEEEFQKNHTFSKINQKSISICTLNYINSFRMSEKENSVYVKNLTDMEALTQRETKFQYQPREQLKISSKIGQKLQKKKCNCENSQCAKLYCECFASGEKCGDLCHCVGCKNTEENQEEIEEIKKKIKSKNPVAFQNKIQYCGNDFITPKKQQQIFDYSTNSISPNTTVNTSTNNNYNYNNNTFQKINQSPFSNSVCSSNESLPHTHSENYNIDLQYTNKNTNNSIINQKQSFNNSLIELLKHQQNYLKVEEEEQQKQQQQKQSNSNKKFVVTGCSCKKSYCLQNYCECHKNGAVCSSLCRCTGCFNNEVFKQRGFGVKQIMKAKKETVSMIKELEKQGENDNKIRDNLENSIEVV